MDRAMNKVTYEDMVTRYGNTQAFDLLLTLERLAQIKNDIFNYDEESRLQNALDALNQIDFAN